MLNLMIKLTGVAVIHDYDGDKLATKVTVKRPVWVNAHHIRQVEVLGGEGDEDDAVFTRIALGGEDFAYVQEDPETICVMIDFAKAGEPEQLKIMAQQISAVRSSLPPKELKL